MNVPSASLGRYFCFCSAVPYQTMGSVPMPACAEKRDGEAALLGDVLGDDGGGHLVHLQAAVLLGDIDGGEAEVGGLLASGGA